MRAVVLVSGGLDSTTCLALAVEQGFDPVALTFAYGQRHQAELGAARRVVAHYGAATHLVVDLGVFRAIGGSALTADLPVPMDAPMDGIPVTYVPARNLVFLSIALGVAEVHGAADIFIGVNALDYSGYPDCRPAFVEQFERTANLAVKAAVEGERRFRVQAPLLHLSKAEIVRLGARLGVPWALTSTCYAPAGEVACGRCDACRLRLRGFAEAGLPDPIAYATPP